MLPSLKYALSAVGLCVWALTGITQATTPRDTASSNFLVLTTGDTIDYPILKLTPTAVVVQKENKKKRYNAKKVHLAYRDGRHYESGKLRYNFNPLALNNYVFLQKQIAGSISVYSLAVNVESTIGRDVGGSTMDYQGKLPHESGYRGSSPNTVGGSSIGEDLVSDIILGVDGNPVPTSNNIIYYVRRADDSRGRFHRLSANWRKNLKRVGNDCPSFVDQVNESPYWRGTEHQLKFVLYYNENCRH